MKVLGSMNPVFVSWRRESGYYEVFVYETKDTAQYYKTLTIILRPYPNAQSTKHSCVSVLEPTIYLGSGYYYSHLNSEEMAAQ